jgi:hypothetical protein
MEHVHDVLDADADMIVQQCNCCTRKPHGLSDVIARHLPYANVYALRQGRGTPGTVVICAPPPAAAAAAPGEGAVRSGPLVACLMAQISPGKPGTWCKQYGIDPSADDAASRLRYFQAALDALKREIIAMGPGKVRRIAFPFRIGCGLAGGDTVQYDPIIDAFAKGCDAMGIKATVYHL